MSDGGVGVTHSLTVTGLTSIKHSASRRLTTSTTDQLSVDFEAKPINDCVCDCHDNDTVTGTGTFTV